MIALLTIVRLPALAAIFVGVTALVVAVYVLWARALDRAGDDALPHVPIEERRVDLLNRDRIAILEARYRAVAAHLTVGLAVLSACMLLALVGIYVLFAQLQDSRIATARDTCERNRTTVQEATRRFPDIADVLKRAFPYEDDCQAYAERRVRTH
jgi:hypothetical protein